MKTYKDMQKEEERGKRRYLERLIEEEEAQKEIDSYEEEEFPDGNEPR